MRDAGVNQILVFADGSFENSAPVSGNPWTSRAEINVLGRQ